MTTPQGAVAVQPDPAPHVWAQLKHIEGVTCFVYAAVPRWPEGWLVTHSFQVDARAAQPGPAWERAEQARQILVDLWRRPWADGVVVLVDVTEGPFYLADPDGQPRYVLRADVRVHPAPGGPAGPVPVAAPALDHAERRTA
jgi:hypothetical protein